MIKGDSGFGSHEKVTLELFLDFLHQLLSEPASPRLWTMVHGEAYWFLVGIREYIAYIVPIQHIPLFPTNKQQAGGIMMTCGESGLEISGVQTQRAKRVMREKPVT